MNLIFSFSPINSFFNRRGPNNFSLPGDFSLGTNLAQVLNYTQGCLFNHSVLTGEGSRKAPFFFSSLERSLGVIFGANLGNLGASLGVILGANLANLGASLGVIL